MAAKVSVLSTLVLALLGPVSCQQASYGSPTPTPPPAYPPTSSTPSLPPAYPPPTSQTPSPPTSSSPTPPPPVAYPPTPSPPIKYCNVLFPSAVGSSIMWLRWTAADSARSRFRQDLRKLIWHFQNLTVVDEFIYFLKEAIQGMEGKPLLLPREMLEDWEWTLTAFQL